MPRVNLIDATDQQVDTAWFTACQLIGADPRRRFQNVAKSPCQLHVRARYVAAWGVFAEIPRVNRADVLRRLGFSCTNSMASLYNARGSNWWRDDLMRRVAQALRGDDFARGLPLNVLIAKQSRRNGVVLPRWVPSDLRDDFFDVAELYGEEAAASHCRALKREMEAGHA